MGTELFFQTMERLTPQLRAGDLAGCELAVADTLRTLPNSPFHIAADLAITNDPAEAARHFDDFYRAESKRISVQAVYTEMNGFDMSPDRWYCDLFAYTDDGGLDDFDWLSAGSLARSSFIPSPGWRRCRRSMRARRLITRRTGRQAF